MPPFHLITITYTHSGFDTGALLLVKPGHSTDECGDPNAFIVLRQGTSLTPDQVATLYGSTQPHFSTTHPLTSVACFNGPGGIPDSVWATATIQND